MWRAHRGRSTRRLWRAHKALRRQSASYRLHSKRALRRTAPKVRLARLKASQRPKAYRGIGTRNPYTLRKKPRAYHGTGGRGYPKPRAYHGTGGRGYPKPRKTPARYRPVSPGLAAPASPAARRLASAQRRRRR